MELLGAQHKWEGIYLVNYPFNYPVFLHIFILYYLPSPISIVGIWNIIYLEPLYGVMATFMRAYTFILHLMLFVYTLLHKSGKNS